MAMKNNFKDARKLKQIGDAIEKEEIDEAIRKTRADVETLRKLLLAKQEKDQKFLREQADATVARLVQQRDNVILGYLKRMVKLDGNIHSKCAAENTNEADAYDENKKLQRVTRATENQLLMPFPPFKVIVSSSQTARAPRKTLPKKQPSKPPTDNQPPTEEEKEKLFRDQFSDLSENLNKPEKTEEETVKEIPESETNDQKECESEIKPRIEEETKGNVDEKETESEIPQKSLTDDNQESTN
jgi:hypothetical protein